MATNQQIEELLLVTKGVPELRELRDRLREALREKKDLQAALDAGTIAGQRYAEAMRNVNRQVQQSAQALKQLTTGGTGLDGYRTNLISLSYVLNDFFSVQGNFQQQLISISNNMPALLAGFGGLGYALGAILPIVASLSGSIGELWKAFSGKDYETARTKIDELKKKLDDWAKDPPKLALDFSAFDAAKRQLETLERAVAAFERTRRTAEQESVEAEASRAVKETIGADALAGAFAQDAKRRGLKGVIPQALLDQMEQARQAAAGVGIEGKVTSMVFAGQGAVTEAQARQAVVGGAQRKIVDLQAQIDALLAEEGKKQAGLFAAGDVGAIARGKRLPVDLVGPEFNRAAGMLPSDAEQLAARRAAARAIQQDARDQERAERERQQEAERIAEESKVIETQRKVLKREEAENRAANQGVADATGVLVGRFQGAFAGAAAQNAAEAKAMAGAFGAMTDLDERAGAAAAQLRARGVPEDEIARRLRPELARQMRGMGAPRDVAQQASGAMATQAAQGFIQQQARTIEELRAELEAIRRLFGAAAAQAAFVRQQAQAQRVRDFSLLDGTPW